MSVWLFILLAVAVLLLFSGGYVLLIACGKRSGVDWLDEKAMQKSNNAHLYPYIAASKRWLNDRNAHDVYTTAADGVKLHALWIPVDNSKGTVLMAHGYRSTMLLDFHLGFELFHQLGMNILVPEQRTHGESGGRFITFGVKESRDMQRWIAFHNAQLANAPMILYGMSMGASTMLYLADRVLPDNVKGIIADCGFTSPKEIISRVYRRALRLPAEPSVSIASVFAKIFAGFGFSKCDTRKSLRNSRLPVLMIHGQADSFVPCEMSEQGYQVCTSKKQLLIVPDAEHGMSFLADGFRYTAAVIDFMKETIPGFQPPEKESE